MFVVFINFYTANNLVNGFSKISLFAKKKLFFAFFAKTTNGESVIYPVSYSVCNAIFNPPFSKVISIYH